MNINSIQFITPEEIAAMPIVDMEVTHRSFVSKNSSIRSEQYSAELQFDRVTRFRLNISGDEFALLHYFSNRKYVADQFTVKAKARVVETKWPEKNGQKAHSSYKIDIYLTNSLRWSFDLTHSKFLEVLQNGVNSGALAYMKFIERTPGAVEKDTEAEAPKEEAIKDDKLPF